MKLVFLHGWSFDAQFWQPVLAELNDRDSVVLERGYGNAAPALSLPDTPFLAIGHSAGVLWLLSHHTPQCRGILSFNGFSRFSQAPDFAQGIPARIVTRMRTRLAPAPGDCVAQFRQQFDSCPPCPPTLNATRLAEGLTELLECDGRETAHALGPALTAIQGTHDPLISADLHQACFPAAQRLMLEGGHLLPLTAPALCAALITSTLEALS